MCANPPSVLVTRWPDAATGQTKRVPDGAVSGCLSRRSSTDLWSRAAAICNGGIAGSTRAVRRNLAVGVYERFDCAACAGDSRDGAGLGSPARCVDRLDGEVDGVTDRHRIRDE